MLIKALLVKMDPDVRAFTLVGAFLGYFALLERGIETALGQVLGIKGPGLSIVGRNMGFEEKIKTLRSVVAFFVIDRTLAEQFDELARRARKHGELRNLVAHSPFRGSHASDGVEFFPRAANRKLEFPEMDWSLDDFLMKISEIYETDDALRELEKKMALSCVAEALVNASAEEGPLAALFGLPNDVVNATSEAVGDRD